MMHPKVKSGSLTLRKYQEQIISRAVDANTLVVLPTGLGKTIIAAMVAAHRLQSQKGSKIIFVAPTKPLVVQHMRSFKKFLNVENMCVLTGNDPPKKRSEMFASADIIFATPQTIENDIIRGLDFSDVSLIIFDEAHRTVGNYSYVQIAKRYIQKAKNPQILALTASPSSEKAKVDEICSNLFIQIVEAKSDADPEVSQYIQEVEIEWVRVELPSEFKQIQQLIQSVLSEQLRKLKESGYVKTQDLTKVNKRMLLAAQSAIRADIVGGGFSFTAASLVASAIKISHAVELFETQGVNATDEYLKRLAKQNTKAVKTILCNPDMISAIAEISKLRKAGVEHPKIERLVKIVSRYRGRKVLVFTQYRDSVTKIIDSLNAADILANEFIGQQSRGLKAGMTQKNQIDTLKRFEEGQYTALVATSVAEEGLDIPQVDAVIFYEPVPSEIRSIQRRGRTGRQASGKVYVMIAKGTRDEGIYWASYHKEKKMGRIVEDMRSETSQLTPNLDGAQAQKSITSYTEEDTEDILELIVDSRERNTKIMSILSENCRIDLKNLPVGDYLISDRVCIERKTVDDFLQSIVDKRLMVQLSQMREHFELPILIVEGKQGLYEKRNIHPNAIRGALAAAAIDLDISVLFSESEVDTAQLIIAAAKREQIDNKRPIALRGEKKPEILADMQRFVIESLPNVSAVLAQRLLLKFKTIENIVNASPEDLQDIEGIGRKKAAEINRIITARYGEK